MARKDTKSDLPSEGESDKTTQTAQGTTSKRRRRKPVFYTDSLDTAEQAQMGEAMEMEGLDEEIALLRVRLRRVLEEQPEDTEFLLKGIALLAKLLATRYRLSSKAEDDLYQNLVGVIKGVGGAIWPEMFSDGKG